MSDRQPTMIEQLVLQNILAQSYPTSKIIVHHISKNTPHFLQLEVEIATGQQIKFERLFITNTNPNRGFDIP